VGKIKRKYRLIIYAVIGLGIIGSLFAAYFYMYIFDSNVFKKGEIYLSKQNNADDIAKTLYDNGIIKDYKSLLWVMDKKNYNSNIHSGRYILKKGMNNNEIVNKLRSGNQDAIKLTFNNIRTKEDFAGRISKVLMLDSLEIISYLNNPQVISHLGFNENTIIGMFIPNTYYIYWDIALEDFMQRMHKEYIKYWSSKRKKLAQKIGLKPIEVITLASIIEEETIKKEEYPIIAGVYMNRLKRGIPLSACPTLKFASGDFTLKRILNKHKNIESPYNTYKYKGLPPGPIRQPSTKVVDAVLHYKKHKYLYFCARYDFSGYHYFSKTLSQHNKYAQKYRIELNKRKIYK
jgi:UPF0755 protein